MITQEERIELLACPVDRLDMTATVRRCLRLVEEPGYHQHIAMNAAKLVAYQEDAELRAIVGACDLVSADGQSLVWAARLLGRELPGRVAGIDLMNELIAAAAARRLGVFFLGARPDVLARAMQRLRERYPALNIVGFRDGYFSSVEVAGVCQAIREARPDILFVAMSSPAKERFLNEHGPALGVPFAMGVGGAVDVIAGETRRAPVAWQRLGLEWLYRTLQEPRRLGPRYLRTNGRFVALVMHEWWRTRESVRAAVRR